MVGLSLPRLRLSTGCLSAGSAAIVDGMTSTLAFDVESDVDSAPRRPSLGGSLAFLLLSFPLGILWFVLLVTLLSVGIGTAVIWVGIGVLALAVVLWRAGAHAERARVFALLDVRIPARYRPLPERRQWRTWLADGATWRDFVYLILLFPIGIFEFVLMVVLWSTSLAAITLPIYFRWLPTGSYRFPTYGDGPVWFVVNSTVEALPIAVLGLVLLAITVPITRGTASAHAQFARFLLGPVPR